MRDELFDTRWSIEDMQEELREQERKAIEAEQERQRMIESLQIDLGERLKKMLEN